MSLHPVIRSSEAVLCRLPHPPHVASEYQSTHDHSVNSSHGQFVTQPARHSQLVTTLNYAEGQLVTRATSHNSLGGRLEGNRPIIRGFDSPTVRYRVHTIDRPSVRVRVTTTLSKPRINEPSVCRHGTALSRHQS